MSARFGCVVLSRGRRPDTLKEGVESILRQTGVDVDVVVVGNGWQPDGLPSQVRTLGLAHNLGIPAGRNAGVPLVSGDFLLFLDDDASLAQDDALQQVASLLDRQPDIGVVQLHPIDPDGWPTPGRWIPRLRVGDEYRSSDICALWEGAIVVRRETFERSGGWPSSFFYMHEGIDLAWRVWDAGYRVYFAGDILAHHPAASGGASNHTGHHRFDARNRVWLARRNLPLPLGAAYVGVWTALSLARLRRRQQGVELLRGALDGLMQPCDGRRPMRWRTAWRMTLAGRPPII
jgi:GT2 family glycosyltransferase